MVHTMMGGNGSSTLLSRAAQSALSTSAPVLVHLHRSFKFQCANVRITGNFTRDGAADFLGGFAEVLTPSDSMIVAVDSCSNPAQV